MEFTVWSDKENRNCIKGSEATDQSSASLLGNQQGSPRHEGNEEMELEYMADRPSAALVRNQHGFPPVTSEPWSMSYAEVGYQQANS
jgi:hypothetical protein